MQPCMTAQHLLLQKTYTESTEANVPSCVTCQHILHPCSTFIGNECLTKHTTCIRVLFCPVLPAVARWEQGQAATTPSTYHCR
jgi:hypothetical protein